MKRALILLAKFALAAGLFAYLFWTDQIDLEKLTEIQSWGWVIVAQLLVAALLALTALRWQCLLRAQGIEQPYRETFILGAIGFYFNQFMPGSVGGDLMKAYYIAVENPDRRARGVTTVFLDRVFGLLVLMAIGGGSILFNLDLVGQEPRLQFLSVFVLVGLLGVLVTGLLFFNDRFRSQAWLRALFRRLPFNTTLRKIEEAVYVYRHHPGAVFLAIVLSVLIQASVVLINVCFFFALGGSETVSVAVFFLTVPLVHLAMAVPVSPPGGLGVGEWAMSELLGMVGYAQGFTLAIFQRLSWYLWALPGLVFYLRRKKKVQEAIARGEGDPGDGEASPDREGADGVPGEEPRGIDAPRPLAATPATSSSPDEPSRD